MRSYGQYCAIAKALDVIGDRWNLLIVRELLLRGACRYTDLQGGLPGIASNLLADRLRDLERSGVILREDAPAPVASTVFRLTERGRSLEPLLRELLRWGAPLMAEPADGDAFRSHWLDVPVQEFVTDAAPDQPPVAIELRAGDEPPVTLETAAGAVRARHGAAQQPALVLSGPPQALVGVLIGGLPLREARALGLRCEGDVSALARLKVAGALG
jgi:DNA-binding HxlR family transcriptional regulator